MPVAAQAQTPPAHIDAYPADVYADGLGGLQVVFDGRDDGEFAPAGQRPAGAGLEIRTAAGASAPSDPARVVLDRPTLSADEHTITSRYRVGAALEVTE